MLMCVLWLLLCHFLQHVYECLKLTDEFRQLSKHHANHEDKLQVCSMSKVALADFVEFPVNFDKMVDL